MTRMLASPSTKLKTSARMLVPNTIVIDGFVIAALKARGITEIQIAHAIHRHEERLHKRDPLPLTLPDNWGFYGNWNDGHFELDRLDMGSSIWFSKGQAGTPHVIDRRPNRPTDLAEVVGKPLDLGIAFNRGFAPPIVRTATAGPNGWLYMDVDAIDYRI